MWNLLRNRNKFLKEKQIYVYKEYLHIIHRVDF